MISIVFRTNNEFLYALQIIKDEGYKVARINKKQLTLMFKNSQDYGLVYDMLVNNNIPFKN